MSSVDPVFNVQLLRLTGLRISELINLPTDCVVSLSDDGPFLKAPLGKMNNERLVPLHQDIVDIINRIRDHTQQINPSSKRLIGIDGKISSVYSRLKKPFKIIVGDIIDQDKPVTFHRLRHTYATTLLSAGVSIISIMKLLGHRRIEMTLRYAKVVPSHLRSEYLKAIEILKQTWLHAECNASTKASPHISAVEIIDLLRCCIVKDENLNTKKQRAAIRRIDRLKAYLKPPSSFVPTPNQGHSVTLWSG